MKVSLCLAADKVFGIPRYAETIEVGLISPAQPAPPARLYCRQHDRSSCHCIVFGLVNVCIHCNGQGQLSWGTLGVTAACPKPLHCLHGCAWY